MRADEVRTDALCKEVLERVLADARSRSTELQTTLEAALAQVRERSLAAQAALEAEQRQRCEQERTRAISQARFKAQRAVRSAMEDAVARLVDEGYAACLEAWARTPAAHAEELALEGIAQMAGAHFEVRVDRPAAARLPADFPDRLVRRARESLGRDVTVVVSADSEGAAAGLRVLGPDGRSTYDNSLRDRFRRCREAVRAAVAGAIEEEIRGLQA